MELLQTLAERLSTAGCIAPLEEAAMLVEAATQAERGTPVVEMDELDRMVARRMAGEPVEWIVGWAPFCGLRVRMRPGVYVPRVQTEVLAEQASRHLPRGGTAADLATGSGAVALVMRSSAPGARVVATEIDRIALRCAASNGIEVFEGDLDEALPASLERAVDVLTANVPYVPTEAIAFLPRDVVTYEPRRALDGGPDGLQLVRRVLALAPRWLRPGRGRVLVEIGPDQAEAVESFLAEMAELRLTALHLDAEDEVRAVEAVSSS